MTRLLLALLLVTASATLLGQPVCGAIPCPSMQCFGPCGGQGCLCMRKTISEPGWCYSAQLAPALLERGYREIP